MYTLAIEAPNKAAKDSKIKFAIIQIIIL